MKNLFHIIKYKLILFLRFDAKLNLREFLKIIGSSIIYIGFAIGTFFFTKYLIWFLLAQIKIGLFLLHEFISMVLFIFFLSVNIGNIIVSYSTLYKSSEISFLITRPVEPIKIFFIKFMDNFFYSSSTLILILLSVLSGYAIYFKMNILSLIIFLFFNFIPFIFSAGCLGVIILLLVMKLAIKYNLRKLIITLSTSYIFLVYLFFKIQSPIKLVNLIMQYYPLQNRDKYFAEIIPAILKYLPNHWLSESAYWLIQKNISEAIPLFINQLLLSTGLFVVALLLGKKWYHETLFKNIKFRGENFLIKNFQKKFFNFSNESFLFPQSESIIKKDFWIFVREPSQLIHFSLLLLLIIIFIISIGGIQYIGFGNYYLQTIIYLSVILFNLLFISTLSLRFVFPIISLEGQSFWKLRSSPLTNKFIINKKIFPWGIIIFCIAQSLNFFSNYKFGMVITIITTLITAFSTLAIFSINFGMGGLFVNYKEKNPIRLASSRGASLSFLLNVLFMLLVIAFLINPFSEYFLNEILKKEFNYPMLIYPSISIAILSIMISVIFYRAGLKTLERDFI